MGEGQGWGKNWEWLAEVERRGLLQTFDDYVNKMPLDLLQVPSLCPPDLR